MINKLIFYNNNNNGDIHFTREFVRDIIGKTSYDEYYFYHKRSPKLLMDIPNLQHGQLNINCKTNLQFYIVNNETYINTHLLGLLDSPKSVNLDIFYDYFQIIYDKLKIPIEPKRHYLPIIDYNQFEISNVNEYLLNNKSFPKVLICNGDVHSNQSFPLDFKFLIEKVATEFPQIHFILTDKKDIIEMPNVLYSTDIINTFGDLNEISYLSKFCSIIIGRASGPYSFAEVKENFDDPDKTFIFLCYIFSDGMWYEQTLCSKIWINEADMNNIYEIIQKQLKLTTNYNNMFDVTSSDNKIIITPFSNIPHPIRIDFYQDINLLYKYSTTFINGIFHWVQPHGHYQTGNPIKCKFYNDETNEYLFQKMV